MPSMQSLAVAASVFAGLSAATPVNVQTGAFTLNQQAVGKVPRVGALAMLRAHQKYGVAPPADVLRAAGDGSVVSNPAQYDSQYTCPVTVGCVDMNLNFDTGSSDLWVFSSLLSSQQAGSHKIYDPKKCGGKVVDGASWSIKYGDQSGAAGSVYADKVVVGPITATGQSVEAATSVSSQFTQNTANDGLVGMGFANLNTVKPKKATTFFDTIKGSLSKQIFAVTLKHQKPGSWDFGFIDNKKFVGDLTYVNVNTTPGYWKFDADGYAIGEGKVVNGTLTGIADTGTTLLMLPDAVVKPYYAQIPKATYNSQFAGYVFPCNTKLPDFTVIIGGKPFVVPSALLNFAPTTILRTSCYGGLQSSEKIGINIFGDIFLKSLYVVHQQDPPQLGFAKQA